MRMQERFLSGDHAARAPRGVILGVGAGRRADVASSPAVTRGSGSEQKEVSMIVNEAAAASRGMEWGGEATARPMPLWKRALDVACITVTLPLWAPVMMILAVAIKCVSPGPILFRHER